MVSTNMDKRTDIQINYEDIKNSYISGKSMDDISKELGISSYKVRKILLECGVVIRGNCKKENYESIKNMYIEGSTLTEISEELHIPIYSVKRVLLRCGIELREQVNKGRIYDKFRGRFDEIVDAYKTGEKSVKSISEEFGISETTVRKILSDNGVTFSSKGKSKYDRYVRKVLSDFRCGKSEKVISEYYNIPIRIVRKILSDNGIYYKYLGENSAARKKIENSRKNKSTGVNVLEEYIGGYTIKRIAYKHNISIKEVMGLIDNQLKVRARKRNIYDDIDIIKKHMELRDTIRVSYELKLELSRVRSVIDNYMV